MSAAVMDENHNSIPPRQLWRGAALNLASRAAAVVIGMIILVLVARQGPRVQGAFSLFVAIDGALVALGSGLGLLLAREAARMQDAFPARRLSVLLVAGAAIGVLCATLLLLASRLADREPFNWLWMLALSAPCLLLAPTVSGLWMGQGKLLPLNAVQVASPAAVLILLVAATAAGIPGLAGALGAWVLGKSLAGAAAARWALRWARHAPAASASGTTPLREASRFVALIAVANIASLANYRVTLFLLEGMRGLAIAGVYSVAAQVAELLWLLSWAITVSSYATIGSGEAASAAATTVRAVRAGMGAVLVAAPLLALVAWIALPSVMGESYRGSIAPMLVLFPGVIAYASASALSAYYTQHLGRPYWAAGIAGLSLALTTAAGLWCIPRWGAIGGALATSSGYLLAIAFAMRRFLRDAGLAWSVMFRGLPR
jgi:O-antigen/teichoic acid export membrane protein